MQPNLLLELYEYNQYANRVVLETAGKLRLTDLYRESSPSHGSVFGLLAHMLAVETGYLANCRGELFKFERPTTLEDLAQRWETLAEGQLAYLAELKESQLVEVVPARIGSQDFQFPRWQLMAQALIHSTHHRGELSIILTEIGQPLPVLDIIIPFAEESGQPWPWK